MSGKLLVRQLGLQPYATTWQAMQDYTNARDSSSPDQLWLLEHPPVFTQGQTGKAEHLLDPGTIPVMKTDRGGQVTYHGPGQLIVYLLLDLRRAHLGIHTLVSYLEEAVIALLAEYAISASARRDAPGVYIEECKIASLGLRVRRGCCFHGLSLNLDMDLDPFKRINPCGHPGLKVTQLADQKVTTNILTLGRELSHHLAYSLGYTLTFVDTEAGL
ncbi:MAG: lipoyl(octanoyl) transferase LipB [Candidatus Thiodiazotropha sp. (ex Lucinoma aequizonata)]|nr:lipoyl(octanoyl) transferase LipB [Candidatus Thiodiazotropha sp. (ex Lucinoma aequizonata)]MCU7887128.1 lipoyl(octanoyl) transferase LipB [Candidatus Thiodiazotropha sp. (ex Lucinoma aequizonata)]MCU7896143.1 lipoyl(octanoyl) transferase LipB [Candidatus Thiodiazotropha sp. (ex Lucinoma aequizonata)]MCU7898259.1 lipoyl(octanoyl) transferase LipB [Candidatus Thiodiazotropha sp. (ex Lucinoma aequizonata)]MCU7901814.1 lipoyl(octanoyl) transferase LipB [Candidatus Thiodiazotropha sp. (ex Lucino